MLLLGEDGRLCIFRADDSGDLEELQTGDILASQQWQSGSLFDDVDDTFRLAVDTAEEDLTSVLMFLVTSEGGLQVGLPLESKITLISYVGFSAAELGQSGIRGSRPRLSAPFPFH